jgi:Na+-driven multidrug efflux pump
MGVTYLRDVAPSYIPLGIGVTLGGAIVGSGATRTALVTDACVIALVQLPLALISAWALHADIGWLFRSVTAANIGFCLAYLVVYTRRGWLTPRKA